MRRALRTLAMALVALLVVASVACAQETTDAETKDNARVRIGTFDTRAVALCYGRSQEFLDMISGMKQEHKEAVEKGDDERVAELEELGPMLQEKLHEQVFFGAPIPELIADLEGEMAGIAEAANVDVIAGELLYVSPETEFVDITRFMVAPYNPSAKTLEILEELMVTPAAEHE